MNKKNITQILIIVAAFGASGAVLYNGFFKSNNNTAALQTVSSSPIPNGATPGASAAAGSAGAGPGTSPSLIPGSPSALGAAGGTIAQSSVDSSANSQNLLPYGDKLDYGILNKNDLQSPGLVRVKLNFQSNVGIPETNLIAPVASGQ